MLGRRCAVVLRRGGVFLGAVGLAVAAAMGGLQVMMGRGLMMRGGLQMQIGGG